MPLFRMCLLIVCLPLLCRSAEPQPTAQQLQKLVEESAAKYAEAFNQRDVQALVSLFTPQAEYVDDAGTVFHGQSVIAEEVAAIFENLPSGQLEIAIASIRPIAEGVLVEEGISTFIPKETESRLQTRYVAMHVQQKEGHWLIASVRELESSTPSIEDRLQPLAWLVGSWQEDVQGNSVTTRWSWAENKNFLLGNFIINRVGEVALKGTHRIGWDAERRQLRSWVFDESGQSGEGWWRQNEDESWSVQLSIIGTDGIRLNSVLTYSQEGTDAIRVTHEKIVREGDSLPGSTHRIVKQPPEPASSNSK